MTSKFLSDAQLRDLKKKKLDELGIHFSRRLAVKVFGNLLVLLIRRGYWIGGN